MKIRSVFFSFARLATGEVFGRMATFALFAYVSRQFGVEILGIVALAQTVAGYVMECSDQGLKLIGARLLARNHALATFVVPFVLKRRAALTVIAIVLGAMYALLGPIPSAARACVLAFDLAVIPYAFALDWVAWGLGHFGVLSIWRSGVSILYVAMAIVAMQVTMRPIASISGANILSAVAGAGFLWMMWRLRWKRRQAAVTAEEIRTAAAELRPSRVATLGVANLLNLVFMNSDILLLGALTGTAEVGRYSAACKPLYIIFTGFWLLTDALYPYVAKVEAGAQAHRTLLIALGVLAIIASAAALSIGLFAPQILSLIYGSTLGATRLFRILLIALPIDFCFSLLWTVLVSRGYERPVLYSLGAAAGANVILNLVFIPRFQANAAAWATVACYALLFSMLLVFVLRNKVLTHAAASEAAETSAAWA
ncbi:MAG: polysaccharide biosynthesis C-terminal domain-containing protein [Candidatus Korobacteraceae bacterium]